MLQAAFKKIGVNVYEISGGDVSQAFTTITNNNYKYTTADMFTWYWHPYIDPNYNLSVVTKSQWGNSSDTGYDDPKYDAWWKQQQLMVNSKSASSWCGRWRPTSPRSGRTSSWSTRA